MKSLKKLQPKVTILTISYNQKDYIKQALNSFLAQKVEFDIEIIVADDASTDGTAEIIKSYAKKHPKLFRLILREKNVGPTENFYDALLQARGKYIALCEGDDYWTDSNKLSLQVDLMEKHRSLGLCFHPVRVFFQDKSQPDSIFPPPGEPASRTVDELVKANFIQTNSVLYRRQSYDHVDHKAIPVDWYMHLYHAQFGNIGFIDKVMSDYRRHSDGIWWKASRDQAQMWRKNGASHLILFQKILEMFPDKKELVLPNVYHILNQVTKISSSLLTSLVKQFPDFSVSYIKYIHQAQAKSDNHASNLTGVIEIKDSEISSLRDVIKAKEQDIERLSKIEHEYNTVRRSWPWRMLNYLRAVKRRLKNG